MDPAPTPTPPAPPSPPSGGPDPDPGFYQRAFRRLPRWMAAVAVLALPFVWWHGGALWAASFLVGAIGGYWNYIAICRAVDRLTHAVEQTGAASSSNMRRLLRLLFIGVAVFVIIRFTRINLVAAFMGLLTPVGAVVVEILYELGPFSDRL
jgi:hypothetical protein